MDCHEQLKLTSHLTMMPNCSRGRSSNKQFYSFAVDKFFSFGILFSRIMLSLRSLSRVVFQVSTFEVLLQSTPKDESKTKAFHTLAPIKVLLDWLHTDLDFLSYPSFKNSL